MGQERNRQDEPRRPHNTDRRTGSGQKDGRVTGPQEESEPERLSHLGEPAYEQRPVPVEKRPAQVPLDPARPYLVVHERVGSKPIACTESPRGPRRARIVAEEIASASRYQRYGERFVKAADFLEDCAPIEDVAPLVSVGQPSDALGHRLVPEGAVGIERARRVRYRSPLDYPHVQFVEQGDPRLEPTRRRQAVVIEERQ